MNNELMLSNMKAFCDNDHFLRKYLQKPIIYGGDVLCTNGHIAIIFTGTDFEGEIEIKESVDRAVNKLKNQKYNESISIPSIKKIECDECSGTGKDECRECHGSGIIEFDNDFNLYEVDCKSCEDGNNKECKKCHESGFQSTTITYKNKHVNANYIDSCNKNLTNPKFLFDKSHDEIRVEHDHGYGFIMPMREPFKRNFEISDDGELLNWEPES